MHSFQILSQAVRAKARKHSQLASKQSNVLPLHVYDCFFVCFPDDDMLLGLHVSKLGSMEVSRLHHAHVTVVNIVP
jgi:hypothetical protein